jgi:small-conductance mechanosensitive channel
LSPIREGKVDVAADINPAIRPSFKANGVVIPIPPSAARVLNDLSAAGALARK